MKIKKIDGNFRKDDDQNGWPIDRPAAVIIPPSIDRVALSRWLHAYWEDHEGSGKQNSDDEDEDKMDAEGDQENSTDLPFELVLPYETHRAMTKEMNTSPVPLLHTNQAAKLLCYPHAPSFLLLPHWSELDDCYTRYNHNTSLHVLLRDLVALRHARDNDLVISQVTMPSVERETRRQKARNHMAAQMALYYDRCQPTTTITATTIATSTSNH